MKPAGISSLRIQPELLRAAEQVLGDGESLSSFVAQAIAGSIERRLLQREFVLRGLRSRDEARVTGEYVDAATVMGRLEGMLDSARVEGYHRLGTLGGTKGPI